MLSLQHLPDTKTVLSVVASLAASAVLIPTIANLRIFPHLFCSQFTLVIEEYEQGYCHELFLAAETYLGTKLAPSIQRRKASKKEKEKKPAIALDRDQEMFDVFENIQVKWRLVIREDSEDRNYTLEARLRSYELIFHKKHKEKVLNSYLPFILQHAKAIQEENKVRQINCLRGLCWTTSTKIDHPMTFETIVMDERLKEEIIGDLNTFMKSKEHYRKMGKARKRGYLIYGPPGTGKSSLIAAMANHLNYSIHELDLQADNFLTSDDIRSVLLHHLDKTILVIKDIDSTVTISYRRRKFEARKEVQKQAMLLKLLQFIDGLWLPRINELIIVVTTNKKEKLDPALLVPGRMDMHIHMPYCTFSSFKQLAFRYCRSCNLEVFKEIQGILEKVEVTHAEIVRELTKSTDSFQGVVKFLREKKLEKDERLKLQRNKREDEGNGEERFL